MIKTIGVLTSGGDAPGMNAAVRAVVRAALKKGIKVYGIRRGYCGLIDGDIFEMNEMSVSNIIHKGGTILYTARSAEFRTEAGVEIAKKTCQKLGLEGLVVIGGDGSFRGAADLSAKGIACVGLPGTIDNDIACTEYTIGYDTAMNTCVEMIDKLQDTCQSHDRCSVVEVMGRGAGFIAVNTGLASGAVEIITKEVPYDLDELARKMASRTSSLLLQKTSATQKALQEPFRKRPASNPEQPFWVTYSVAVLRRFVTVSLQAKWAIMLLNCWKRVQATVLLVCRTTRL